MQLMEQSGTENRWFCSLVVTTVILLQWGIPLVFIGIPEWVSRDANYFTISTLAVVTLLTGRVKKWSTEELLVCGLLVYCFTQTVLVNIFILQQHRNEWLPGFRYLTPLLIIIWLNSLNATARSIADGIIIAAFIAALIVIIDAITPLSAIDAKVHASTISGSERRVVLMHNESAVAITIIVARLLQQQYCHRKWLYIALVAIAYSLVRVSESRLAIGATAIALAIYMITSKHISKAATLTSMMSIALAGAVFGGDKYMDSIQAVIETGDLTAITTAEDSTAFRLTEIWHFRQYYERTDGFGFGLMAISPLKDNFLSLSMFELSRKYGVDYQMALVDIRLYAALYQFGLPALILVVLLSPYMLWTGLKLSRAQKLPHGADVAAVGCVGMAFLISPIPANLFTVDNTVHLGALLMATLSAARRHASRY